MIVGMTETSGAGQTTKANRWQNFLRDVERALQEDEDQIKRLFMRAQGWLDDLSEHPERHFSPKFVERVRRFKEVSGHVANKMDLSGFAPDPLHVLLERLGRLPASVEQDRVARGKRVGRFAEPSPARCHHLSRVLCEIKALGDAFNYSSPYHKALEARGMLATLDDIDVFRWDGALMIDALRLGPFTVYKAPPIALQLQPKAGLRFEELLESPPQDKSKKIRICHRTEGDRSLAPMSGTVSMRLLHAYDVPGAPSIGVFVEVTTKDGDRERKDLLGGKSEATWRLLQKIDPSLTDRKTFTEAWRMAIVDRYFPAPT
jgi:hypothetical protein